MVQRWSPLHGGVSPLCREPPYRASPHIRILDVWSVALVSCCQRALQCTLKTLPPTTGGISYSIIGGIMSILFWVFYWSWHVIVLLLLVYVYVLVCVVLDSNKLLPIIFVPFKSDIIVWYMYDVFVCLCIICM